MAAYIFRLDVEGSGERLMHFIADAHGGTSEREGHEGVYDVGFFDHGTEKIFVWFARTTPFLAT